MTTNPTFMGVLRGSLFGLIVSFLGFSVVPSVRSSIFPAKVDPQLKPYVNQFLRYCHQYEKNCSSIADFRITIDTMSDFKLFFPGIVGVCTPADKVIKINKQYWKEEGPARREQLVFHELGHCILGLEHVDEYEIAVMNPSTLPGNVYLQFYPLLQNELFGCKKDCPVMKFDRSRY